MARVSRIPTGTVGFDCNATIDADSAQRLFRHGYRFAVRYVRRGSAAPNDISAAEIATLHSAGLAVMPVQHVTPRPWVPTQQLGLTYGYAAVDGARGAGIPPGVTLWLDLEDVAAGSSAEDTIAFCNAWYDQARAAGYEPGVYVGWNPGLGPSDLYRRLKFTHYWAAFNLNRDQYPAIRGAQMQQAEPTPADIPAGGLRFPIDTNLVTGDALGGVPTAYAPDEWAGASIFNMDPAQPTSGGVTNPPGTASLFVLGLLMVGAVAFAVRYRFR